MRSIAHHLAWRTLKRIRPRVTLAQVLQRHVALGAGESLVVGNHQHLTEPPLSRLLEVPELFGPENANTCKDKVKSVEFRASMI